MSLDEVRAKAARFDAALDAPMLHEYDRQRAEMLERFPLDRWPSLPLERYALGQDDSSDTFSRHAEFVATQLGSIKGGAANKHIIYKHRNKPGWHFDRANYGDEQGAWEAVRAAFVRAFEFAREGRWSEIDGIPELASGPALLVKSLHLYYPEEVLPISKRHGARSYGKVRPDPCDRARVRDSYGRRLPSHQKAPRSRIRQGSATMNSRDQQRPCRRAA